MGKNSIHTKGLAVFIGAKRSGPVLVAWTERGRELALLDHVKLVGGEQAKLLGTAEATNSYVERFRKANLASRDHGYWFNRTPELLKSALMFGDRGMSAMSWEVRRSRETKSSFKRAA